MTSNEFKQVSSRLLSDPNFNHLDEQLQQPNIFNILNLGNHEIRHSSFLAWLLNPHETHQAGSFFLKHFLLVIATDHRNELEPLDIESFEFDNVEIRREWRDIDLLIITKQFVVCIENKMWSEEHSNQLQRYKNTVDRYFPLHDKVFVFLSPYGKESSEKEVYSTFSYGKINELIQQLLLTKKEELPQSVQSHLLDYQQLIQQNIMTKDDDVSKLAKRLYKEHYKLFDFIQQNKGDALTTLKKKIVYKVKNPNEWSES
jgi:hypothetical protein